MCCTGGLGRFDIVRILHRLPVMSCDKGLRRYRVSMDPELIDLGYNLVLMGLVLKNVGSMNLVSIDPELLCLESMYLESMCLGSRIRLVVDLDHPDHLEVTTLAIPRAGLLAHVPHTLLISRLLLD